MVMKPKNGMKKKGMAKGGAMKKKPSSKKKKGYAKGGSMMAPTMYNPIEENEKKRLEEFQKTFPSPFSSPSTSPSTTNNNTTTNTTNESPIGSNNRGGIISNGGKDYRKSGLFYG